MLAKQFVFDPRIAAIHSIRVNVKSLAAEARIIRHETRRAGPAQRDALVMHRRGRLREESRYAHLALAFVRGRPYKSVEAKCGSPALQGRLYEKVRRHWYQAKERDVFEWLRG